MLTRNKPTFNPQQRSQLSCPIADNRTITSVKMFSVKYFCAAKVSRHSVLEPTAT